MAKLTPKQKVLKRYPNAFAWRPFTVSDYEIRTGEAGLFSLGQGYLAKDAWAAAARRLAKRKERHVERCKMPLNMLAMSDDDPTFKTLEADLLRLLAAAGKDEA